MTRASIAMRPHCVAAGVLLLLLAAHPPRVQAAAAELPPTALRAWQNHARQYCHVIGERYVGARFAPLPSVGIDGHALPAAAGRYLAADFNGDGRQDFVIVTPNGGCSGLNEGRDGPELIVEFVVSNASRYVRDARGPSEGGDSTLSMPRLLPAWLERRGNADVMRYATGSVGAGRCGSLPAHVIWGWDGRHVDVLERYNDRRQRVDAEGCQILAATASSGTGRLAGSGTPAAPGRIPLAEGYYAYVEGTLSSCAKPLGDPWYFDGKRFWEKSDFTDPRHEYSPEALRWEMASGDRFRITYRSRDEDGNWERSPFVNEYVITGPRAFTFVGVAGQRRGHGEHYQHCPNLPASARYFRPKR